jgi:hypothetical protein
MGPCSGEVTREWSFRFLGMADMSEWVEFRGKGFPATGLGGGRLCPRTTLTGMRLDRVLTVEWPWLLGLPALPSRLRLGN